MSLHVPSIRLPTCLLSKHSINEHLNKICTYTLTQSGDEIGELLLKNSYINHNIFPIQGFSTVFNLRCVWGWCWGVCGWQNHYRDEVKALARSRYVSVITGSRHMWRRIVCLGGFMYDCPGTATYTPNLQTWSCCGWCRRPPKATTQQTLQAQILGHKEKHLQQTVPDYLYFSRQGL